ncbi:MAG: hypothetical protein QXD11_00470 [Candidatus Micrarchaeaceae archaeon]
MNIFIDSSSLLFGESNKIDCIIQVYKQYGILPTIPSCVIRELEALSNNTGKTGKAARYLLATIRMRPNYQFLNHDKYKYADNYFIDKAKKGDVVVTNDTKLIKSLRKKGIKAVRLSRKGFFI